MITALGGYPLIVLSVIVAGISFYAWFSGEIDFFDPFYLVSILYFFTFLIRPIALEHGLTGYLKDVPWELVSDAMVYGSISFVFFFLGYLFSKIIWYKGSIFPTVYLDIFETKRIFQTKLLLFLLVVFFSVVAVWLVMSHGGVTHVLENRATVYRGGGIYVSMLYLGLIAFLLIYSLRVQQKISLVSVMLSFILVSSLLLISTGERLRILEMLLGMLVISHYVKSRFSFTKSVVVLSTLLVAVTALLFFRRVLTHAGGNDSLTLEILEAFSRNFLLFDGFVATLEKVPSEIAYSHGMGYLMMFVGLIPRSFWEDKPEWGKSIFTEQVFGVNDSIFTYGLVGEFWWNFGIVGVVCGSFLFGFILGKLYKYLLENAYDPTKVILYYLLMTSLVLRGYKGGFESAFMEIVVKMAMFLPAVYFVSGFRFFLKRKK